MNQWIRPSRILPRMAYPSRDDCYPLDRLSGPDGAEELPCRESRGSCRSADEAEERIEYRRRQEQRQRAPGVNPPLKARIDAAGILVVLSLDEAVFQEEGMPGSAGHVDDELPDGFADTGARPT